MAEVHVREMSDPPKETSYQLAATGASVSISIFDDLETKAEDVPKVVAVRVEQGEVVDVWLSGDSQGKRHHVVSDKSRAPQATHIEGGGEMVFAIGDGVSINVVLR